MKNHWLDKKEEEKARAVSDIYIRRKIEMLRKNAIKKALKR